MTEKPILSQEGYRHSKLSYRRGRWKVTVWRHPDKKGKFAYAIGIGAGVMSGSENSDKTLWGCFNLPMEALKAGVNEARYGKD
jgi:hypothetical protein